MQMNSLRYWSCGWSIRSPFYIPRFLQSYDADLSAESAGLYYHTTNVEKGRICPIDPHVARTDVTPSVATTRRADFRNDVMERDGECVLTQYEAEICDAVHLVSDDAIFST
jgi:hypothetical protein